MAAKELRSLMFGTASETYKSTQDGYTAGTLSGLTFNDDGYSRGCLLERSERHPGSGGSREVREPRRHVQNGSEPLSRKPSLRRSDDRRSDSGGRGSIAAKTIEGSTTDIASEFINLMNAQRNFQANTKVISVSDEMMQDVLNLKRN